MLIGLGLVSRAQVMDENGPRGTWTVAVTPPAASHVPAFSGLYTFTGGGALFVSSQIDHLTNNSILQGSWRRGDHGEINSTEIAFLYAPTGAAIGTLKVRATYQFSDANNFTGSGQQGVCDLNGRHCNWFPGSASLIGTRMEIEEPVGP